MLLGLAGFQSAAAAKNRRRPWHLFAPGQEKEDSRKNLVLSTSASSGLNSSTTGSALLLARGALSL